MSINKMLQLNDYRKEINLDIPFDPELDNPLRSSLYKESIEYVAQSLLNEPNSYVEGIATATLEKKRAYIRFALTVRPALPLSNELIRHINQILQVERSLKKIVQATVLSPVRNNTKVNSSMLPKEIVLWQGDITELAADAIVNAANSALLGCFQPYHKCIDNAIHGAAGPQLRADCAVIMDLQGYAESTGTAKITRAYNLPSTYVLHTVGPIVPNGNEVIAEQRVQLTSCYSSCLSLAAEIENIRSIAFCGISTGVFGYPKEEAADVAVNEVIRWIEEYPGRFDQIIFNVFAEEDRLIYEKVLSQINREEVPNE